MKIIDQNAGKRANSITEFGEQIPKKMNCSFYGKQMKAVKRMNSFCN